MTIDDVRAAIDRHTKVEGGMGEDHDTGIIVRILDVPVGSCDVLVAWDSGVSTPAVSADLRPFTSRADAQQ